MSSSDMPLIRFHKDLLDHSCYTTAILIPTKTGKSISTIFDEIVNLLGMEVTLCAVENSAIYGYLQTRESPSSIRVPALVLPSARLVVKPHGFKGIAMIQLSIAGNEQVVASLMQTVEGAYPRHVFPVKKPKNNQVSVTFWMTDPHTGRVNDNERMLEVDSWPDIKKNYPVDVRSQLSKLMKMENPTGGKLVILHGPPGGGKTRSILTLMKAWDSWSSANVVTDPERLLNDSNYLNTVIFESVAAGGWMFIVVEDGDEFLNIDAKDAKGQDIGRLLNLTDGIIGQGVKILLLISTNLKQKKMNPAVTRDGRCLAEIHYRPFTIEEASRWLKDHGKSADEAAKLAASKANKRGEVTLASLYRLL